MTAHERRFSIAWGLLLVLCAIALTVADTVLLGAGTAFLTSGFNSPRIDSIALALVFLPASLLLDVWLVLCIWLAAVPICRRLTSSRFQLALCAVLLGTGVPVGLAVARYNLFSMLGTMFSIRQSPARESAGMLWETLSVPAGLLWSMAALLVSLVALRVAARIERGRDSRALDAPSMRSLFLATTPLTILIVVLVCTTAVLGTDLHFGLGQKVSGRLANTIIDRVTDLDRDGFGALSRPPDPAPLDPDVYPYALDEPGNGIDENGLAGDHPSEPHWSERDPALAANVPWETRPHFLLVYLESFRYDLLEQRTADGRPLTPFLDQLAGEGSSSTHAYVHSPWTLDSRSQLFSGRFVAEPGEPTLIDDFKSRGYTVAHFSGQDESYGASEEILGTGRADRFYDARQDIERRTSRSTAPVSLQVSWQTLTERIDAYLEEWDGEGPLFLYANVVDTHFPYWHPEIEDLLGVAPLDRSDIRAENAEHVRAAYANTVANVDRAVAHIVASFREKIGDAQHGILVTADHGQALYDGGLLGHGHSLDPAVTHVPLLVWGVGGDWHQPVGPTDIRGLLARNLGRPRPDAAVPRVRFVDDPERRVFQYAPKIGSPAFVALQGLDDRIEYAFHRGRLDRVDASGRQRLDRAEHRDAFERMVWQWETLQRRRAALALEDRAEDAE